ncbi:MAG: hypothetical protein KDC34_17940 [Saprospiraceae bacterium]|nr:hypothetical protein [Saprospiraceae bacterium]
MTLQDFFDKIYGNPMLVLWYFLALLFTAVLAGFMSKGEGHQSPWKYLYSGLIYLVSIPGIFAVALNIYLFLFERKSIMEMDLVVQVLPVIAMILILWVIRKNVDLDYIPGFDKLGGLITIIGAALAILWVIDRTHLVVFSYVPVIYLLLLLVGLIVIIRFGWKRMSKG